MLNVTRLLCSTPTPGDGLRYGEPTQQPDAIQALHGVHYRPVVVWNVTRRCNLFCTHCYMAATARPAPGELTTREAMAVVKDLADFRVPVILFSGGEPLLREDLFDLMAQARRLGVQPVLSTNGTLLTAQAEVRLREYGVRRVGISLDGLNGAHDRLRGKNGAFREALAGLRTCVAAGFRVSLRFTLTHYNLTDLEGIFDLAEKEGVSRLCIYHLAYAGRGRKLLPHDLSSEERRGALSFTFQRVLNLHQEGVKIEVLTVDNHADGPYLLLWAQRNLLERVPDIYRLLKANGGNSSGSGIGCIDERGYVHPDQFWRNQLLGNVRQLPFSQIWTDEHIPLLAQLRSRKALLPERCRGCRFLSLCNGNLRARAEAATGNSWGMDPACYLTEEEIGWRR